jgi:hypothetical protein
MPIIRLRLNGAPRVNRRGVVIIPACAVANGAAVDLRISQLTGPARVDGRAVIVPALNGTDHYELHVRASWVSRLAQQLAKLPTEAAWVRPLAAQLLALSDPSSPVVTSGNSKGP